MTPLGIRFLFDENIGSSLVLEIERLLESADAEERATVKHVLAFQGEIGLENQGVWDEVWVPRAAKDGWVVIAGDRGKRGFKKGKKLPDLCAEYGITHFLLSPAVHHRKRFRKLLTVLSVWHELIILVNNSPRGSRCIIEPSGPSAEHCARGKITRRQNGRTPPPPGQLFDKNA